MRSWTKLLLWLVTLSIVSAGTQETRSDPEALLCSPGIFTKVPSHVRQQLEEMHCRIFKKNNLISGKLAADNQEDWAALCVINGKIQPVVLWGGKTQCDAHPAPARDFKELIADPLRDANLGLAGAKKIAMYHDAFGGPGKVFPISHAGLEVGDEQASVIYFCRKGKWVELTGED